MDGLIGRGRRATPPRRAGPRVIGCGSRPRKCSRIGCRSPMPCSATTRPDRAVGAVEVGEPAAVQTRSPARRPAARRVSTRPAGSRAVRVGTNADHRAPAVGSKNAGSYSTPGGPVRWSPAHARSGAGAATGWRPRVDRRRCADVGADRPRRRRGAPRGSTMVEHVDRRRQQLAERGDGIGGRPQLLAPSWPRCRGDDGVAGRRVSRAAAGRARPRWACRGRAGGARRGRRRSGRSV